MRKFLLNILLFLLIVAGVDVAVGSLGGYLQSHAKGGRTKQFDDLVMKDTHDILILGSSRAHSHYDTPFLSESLGMDVYNGGNDGNGIVLAYGILDMVLERYQPQLVLFDVEPAFDIVVYDQDNNHTRYISHLKPYYRKRVASEIIKDVNTKEWYKAQSGLIRFNTEIVEIIVDNVINRGIEKKGYLPLVGSIAKEPNPSPSKPSELDSFKLRYIEKLILLCESKNIPLILVGSPKYGAKNSSAIQPVKETAERYGVTFLDFYADSVFMQHKEWFKEPMHLNREGARRFSESIINDIQSELCNRSLRTQ